MIKERKRRKERRTTNGGKEGGAGQLRAGMRISEVNERAGELVMRREWENGRKEQGI